MNKRAINRFFINVKQFILKHKIRVIAFITLLLFALVTVWVSYAYYQERISRSIVGGKVGNIPDFEIKIMVEDRNSEGVGAGTYSLYPFIPRSNYSYNSSKSYCNNESTLSYDASMYEFSVDTSGVDVCYAYFDAEGTFDVMLSVYLEDIDSKGYGLDTYTMVDPSTIPSSGYSLNSTLSNCTNGSEISYNAGSNSVKVNSSGKDVCDAYFDAIDPDVSIEIYLQLAEGADYYFEANEIPHNQFYSLNTTKSSCAGDASMSIEHQELVIDTTGKASCVAYLDIASGPIIQALYYNTTSYLIEPYSGGTAATKYYVSSDGITFTERTATASYQVGNVIYAYIEDASGNKSAILSADKGSFVYNGYFSYSTAIQETALRGVGYYFIEVWNPQNGTEKGGYSSGYVYLPSVSSTVPVYINAPATGTADVRIGGDTENHRAIITGYGSDKGYIYSEDTVDLYPGISSISSSFYIQKTKSYSGNATFKSPYGQLETGHGGEGYVKITYVGTTIP